MTPAVELWIHLPQTKTIMITAIIALKWGLIHNPIKYDTKIILEYHTTSVM